jgi:uncharacterized protein (DUF58 family)
MVLKQVDRILLRSIAIHLKHTKNNFLYMTTAEILKTVRRIEIKTRGLSNHIFAGEYHSAFKGRGMSFSEVREYMPGDDVKAIDWNVTARFSHPFVKVFEEERELIVLLLVDISNSALFGVHRCLKKELITELSAVLSFSAVTNNDKIGVIFFSDKIEKFIPPKKGRSHVLRIIRELVALEPSGHTKTNVAAALEFLTHVVKKRTISFLMSDFISAPFEQPLQLAARKHDLVGIHVHDRADQALPQVGMMQVLDAETGRLHWIDTDDKKMCIGYGAAFDKRMQACRQSFRKSGASWITMRTDEDYVKTLQSFFKAR